MAKRRHWKTKEKSHIVLEGIKGRPVTELCLEHQISQSMVYAWRDQFLSNMDQAFETKKVNQKEAYQKHQMNKMKKMIADLTIELKENFDPMW